MASAIDSAVSGLNAASRQLQVSANNIANQFSTQTQGANGQVQSTPYTPQQVDQVSLSGGGVEAVVKNVNPATVTVADSGNPGGTQQLPNVNPDNEMINQVIASYDFKANLKTIQVQQEMDQSLLDITT